MMNGATGWLSPSLLGCWRLAAAQELPANGSNGYSLHPPYFNSAEGTKITATATCGEDEGGRSSQDLYCKSVGGPVSGDPSQTIQGQYCDICSQEESDRAHPITNAIDGTERWWQSPPSSRSTEYNEVNVTSDLGQLFHVAYVLIKFANSPRPDSWVSERSTDFGQTYQPWQFFASSKRDCIERFGQRTIERINNDDDVICTTEYSRIVPSENGEIVVSSVNGRPGAMNFSYSPVLRDFTKATNIRLRFSRTNTSSGHSMGKASRDPTVTRRYYYSIKDISIGGRCVCNGHAEACDANDPSDPYKLQCDCKHNTCGVSCDHCCPGFNQLPWKPATTYSANECEPCNCHRHSFDCYYDPEVDRRRASLDIHGHHRGGGVCLNCQHQTTGVNCERCIPTYYRSPNHPIESPSACSPCNCQSEFTDGSCEDSTGRCFCKPNYTGENCDACASGFVNFPQCYPISTNPTNGDNNGEAKPAGEIINCECSAAGTVDNSCRPDPRTGTCVCKPGFSGDHCDSCAPGFYGLNCQACQCSGPGCSDGSCDLMTGHGMCRSGFHGYHCDQCAPGYFNYPLCQSCGCSPVGSLPERCDASGRCLCREEFQGPRCEQCRSGFHSFPNCQECSCDPRTSLDTSCTVSGICNCRPNYSGVSCDQCAPGYYGYPSCTPCQCSPDGSRYPSCDQATGQCACSPGVAGSRCDSCARGSYGFPNCQAGTCHPVGSIQYEVSPPVGECECRPHVEGPACDRCKPLYWNLSPDTAEGCSSCECNVAGTSSGVAECAQETGECHCKPNVCSGTCSTCKQGFHNSQDHFYFGCRGCQCDIGGSVGQFCGQQNGQCDCRPNVEGARCNLPRPDHYFPDSHHSKFEIEEGTMSDGRPVRFGYSLSEFPDFSWRGYAQMSPIQSKVSVSVFVTSPDLFRVVSRYTNSGGSAVRGKVSVIEDSRNYYCGNCSEQSKQIVFAPSAQPTFANVPQNNFVEPFVLNPGTWTVIIEAEGISSDYSVLSPSAYYEAPISQIRVTEPCTYSPVPETNHNCSLYKYSSSDSFPSISGNDANCRHDNHLPRPCPTEKVTPRHPDMAVCSGLDISVDSHGRSVSPGEHVSVVEYASEEESPQTSTVGVNSPGARTHRHRVTLSHCKFSFSCRVVAVDEQNRVAVFSSPSNADIQLSSDRASFFSHKVYLVPKELFTMEYVQPGVHCISTHGHFSPDSSSCVPSRFQTPSDSSVSKEGQSSSTQEEPVQASPAAAPALPPDQRDEPVWMGEVRPPFGADTNHHMRSDSSQNAAVYSGRVQSLGRYVFILHYHQPLHPSYPVQVYINGGQIWQGHTNASFCPHAYGCRDVSVSENQIISESTQHDVFLTVQIPPGKTSWSDYVLVVPEKSYNPNHSSEEPSDKSYDFISNCGQNSFYLNPSTVSPFCLSSAVSSSAFFNNGAMPCACHEVGAESDTCESFGGQCKCRPNVIGRDCSMCATGYWGFPNCRPCNCGPRSCEPVTGDCICPPRTILPECIQCTPQTFGCHPVVGCEVCNCSQPGIVSSDLSCDTDSGQCRCRDNVVGRQCDRCAPGFYGYPNCRPCDCNEAGTEEEVCDSFTGQCLCKENVQGSRCDQCRIGTFHLDPTNPKGCTSCFCFGATDRCQSSDKRRIEIMDMGRWVLLGADRQEVPVTVYPNQDLVEADLSDVPDVYQDLHWHAPKTYSGDKVSSYGGFSRYRSHTSTMRGDTSPSPAEASRPDIILKGNQMTSVFMEREYSAPEDPHSGIVHIVEGSFRHARTGNSVSREESMMVLVNSESLQIRALHSQSAHSVSLRGAVSEGAAPSPSGRHANNVEICMCPANYSGDSCQKCAPGYYRDTIGSFLGKCVPCNCNGHSDQCLDGSGICQNCQHNTVGEHCESCRGGFLSNSSSDGQAVSCSSCPCPLRAPSNNFAEGCVQRGDRMQCLCMRGYAGPNCERCAPGFYGNPMVLGSRCEPCHCNGNTDPNMSFTDCHASTGQCLSCMHNTAGSHCDVCAPGYYGDPIHAKNCTKCNCSQCGTESCDPHTGQCRCKPGVTGPLCDRCQDGTFGFDSCSGCRQCECDASAALVQPCDPQSGQCACQPGVNGPNCRQCAPGHWDYGPDGCRRCECKGGRCDPRTGECRCPDGMTGRQCDTCSQATSVPVEDRHGMHCEPCDSCVVVLSEDSEKMSDDFSSVAVQSRNLNASSMAWAQLDSLNKSIEDAARAIERYNTTSEESGNRADMSDMDIATINADIDDLNRKSGIMTDRVGQLDDSTSHTHQRAEDSSKFINNVTMDINAVSRAANQSLNDTEPDGDEDEKERKFREVQAMSREMRYRSCVGQKRSADREKSEAEKSLDRVKEESANRREENLNSTEAIRKQSLRFTAGMTDSRDASNEAVNNTARAAELNSVNEKTSEENNRKIKESLKKQREVNETMEMAVADVTQVNTVVQMSQESKEEYERSAAQLDGARTPLSKKVQSFTAINASIPSVEDAEKHAASSDALARNLTSLIAEAKKDPSVDLTKAYNNVVNNISAAEEAARMAEKAANDTLENIKNQDLGQAASASKNHSMDSLDEVQQSSDELNNTSKEESENTRKRSNEAKAKQDQAMWDSEAIKNVLNLTSNATEEINEAKTLADKANSTANDVNNMSRPIKEQSDQWQQAYGDANGTSDDINKASMNASETVQKSEEHIPTSIKKLDDSQNYSIQMPNISENIKRIRDLIQDARRAVDKVPVPMKFNGTSAISARTPPNPADLASFTSMKLSVIPTEPKQRKRSVNGMNPQLIFFIGNKNSNKEFMGMSLEEKRSHWYFNLGGETAKVAMSEDIRYKDDKSKIITHYILLERNLQFGQMSISFLYKEDEIIIKSTGEAKGDQGSLNLRTNDTIFYVGGPSDYFQSPAPFTNVRGFQGCIRSESSNGEVLSLYNYEQKFQFDPKKDKPCISEKKTPSQEWGSSAAFFDGTGFAEVNFTRENVLRFSQEVRLLSYKGIILMLKKEMSFVCLAVLQGRLHVFYDFSGVLLELSPSVTDTNQSKVTDGEPKSSELILVYASKKILVRRSGTTVFQENLSQKIPEFDGKYYMGGVPEKEMPESLKQSFSGRGSVRGCFRNVQKKSNDVHLPNFKTSGVSFSCLNNLSVVREAYFSSRSYSQLDVTDANSLKNDFYGSFSFRTDEKDGLMSFHRDKDGFCQVSLEKGHIVVRTDVSEVKTQKTYNDDNSHNVAFYSNMNGLRLYLDDVSEKGGKKPSGTTPAFTSSAEVTFSGGLPQQNVKNLTGCISNVFIKRSKGDSMVENSVKAKENTNVSSSCPAAKKPQQIIAEEPRRRHKGNQRKPSRSRSRSTRESCQGESSHPESRATHFSGSAHSYQRYDFVVGSLKSISHSSSESKINSSDGCVLHAAGRQHGGATMSLSVSKGHSILSVDSARSKVKVRSSNRHDDGRWHPVFIKHEGTKISSTVGGISARSKRLPGGGKSRITAPLFVGGVPAGVKPAGCDGFVGCVRDLKSNGALAGNPAYSQGTVPCFQNPLQPGAYFSGQGGHVQIDDSLVSGRDSEIQSDVRPATDSGLSLHAGTSSDQYSRSFLSQGEVIVSVNGGKGEFSTSLMPEEPLCNRRWHTITAVKRNNVSELFVDGAGEQSAGLKQSRSVATKAAVYLGGAPSGAHPVSLPAFHGCFRHVRINRRPVALSKPLSVRGAVGTLGCPHI